MTNAIVVLCTCPDQAVASQLAERIIKERLAACINLLPEMKSIYVWNDQVEQACEIQLVIKTRSALFEPLRTFIRAHHPYEVPEILALAVQQGDADYLGWLAESCR